MQSEKRTRHANKSLIPNLAPRQIALKIFNQLDYYKLFVHNCSFATDLQEERYHE